MPNNKITQVRMNTEKLREIDDSGNSNAVFRRVSNTALTTGGAGSDSGNFVIRASCTSDAGSGATIAATLYKSDGTTGDAITVFCNISDGTDLNAALPRLEDGDDIFVTLSTFDNLGTPETRFYCVSNFQGSEDCACS